MEINHLNALRLGFSTSEADTIKKMGLANYIANQLNAINNLSPPDFFKNSPKSLSDMQNLRRSVNKDKDLLDNIAKDLFRDNNDLKAFIVQRCYETEWPLREKINLYFQNHFVVTLQSVKIPYWVYEHYATINKYSVGNYKALVKEMIYSNAMIKYLDNQKNRKGVVNENLARELLELFTLGEGNYTEKDVKNTSLSLAGLTYGIEKGQYREKLRDTSQKTVFGKSGNFIVDDVIDIIFEQKNTPYFLAEKVLKWFFYDNPTQDLIHKYGNILKKNNFELKPFFQILFTDECSKLKGGNQIKNPLIYIIQIHKDLNLKPNYKMMAFFLKNQTMDILDQPSVKGWKGGQSWLTFQTYNYRNELIDFVISGNKNYERLLNKNLQKLEAEPLFINPIIKIKNKESAKTILNELTQKMIFQTNDDMEEELDQLLKYDFNPLAINANQSILKVYQYLAKSPEFQII